MSHALLTNSRLKAARRCQRYHKLRYLDGYRPVKEAEALLFGTLIHECLEAWWMDDEDPVQTWIDRYSTDRLDDYTRAKAKALMFGYDIRWAEQEYETLAVEAEFTAPLVNPETGRASQTWVIAGKIDAIVQDEQGRVWIVEHKTSSADIEPGSDYWKRLRLDGQVSLYYEGARALGHDVAGSIYDVIGKPRLRPQLATPEDKRRYKKDGSLYSNQREFDESAASYHERIAADITEHPERYYQRGEVVRLEGEVEEALFDVWQQARQMREAELAGKHPRNPDACVLYNQTCEFFPVCTGEGSLDDPALYRRLDDVHPELEQSA